MTKISAATDGKNMPTYANMEPRFWDPKKVISLFDWKHFPSTAMMTLLHAREFLNRSRLAAGIAHIIIYPKPLQPKSTVVATDICKAEAVMQMVQAEG